MKLNRLDFSICYERVKYVRNNQKRNTNKILNLMKGGE